MKLSQKLYNHSLQSSTNFYTQIKAKLRHSEFGQIKASK